MGKSSQKIRKLPAKMVKFLEKAGFKHELLEHRTVYSAIDAAATLRRDLQEIAKSLLIKADKDYYLVLLPGNTDIDFIKLKRVLEKNSGKGIKILEIPGTKIVEQATKAKNGAVSAFGSLYKVAVVIDNKLANLKSAVFASGSNNFSILMEIKDFMESEKPLCGTFSKVKKIKKQKPMPSETKKKKVK